MKIRFLALFAALWAGAGTAAPAADTDLVFGLVPYLSPQKLTADLTPLRDHLQRAGGRPLTMKAAPTLPEFLGRMRRGDYDIVFAAPHLAWIAEHDLGFKRIAMTGYQVHGFVVVPKESPYQTLEDLRGKKLALPPRPTIIYTLALDLLRSHNLEPDRDIQIKVYADNNAAVTAPMRGDTDAGSGGLLVWEKSGVKDKQRAIAETEHVPGFVLMAHPRVPAALVAKWTKAALSFGDTPQGKANLASTGYIDWRPATDESMEKLGKVLQRKRPR